MAHGSVAAAIRFTPDLVAYAQQLCDDRLAAYQAAPHDAEEHANIETSVLAGGYAYRQVAELIQNAADAIAEAGADAGSGRIVVEADARGLWCANTGVPVDAPGVRALLNSHASGKRAGQIGRFGLGFKSLLRLGGQIDVLSRSVCLHFDPARNRSLIRKHLGLPDNAPAPGLRLADPGTWNDELATAPGAARFEWATTIVFAELVSPGAREAVSEEIRQFPAEFLLFLPCDVELVLRAVDVNRHLRRYTAEDGSVQIEDLVNDRMAPQSWRVFETQVSITDPAAIADATNVHARGSVPLIWATPAGVARETAGRFYAFFPTATETRTLGILNAPWKLNSDRTAVIPGAWNAALMRAAADLIVASLPALATEDDPGAVLDAFPRELGTLNEPAAPLVNALWAHLTSAAVLPNCDGDFAHPAHLHRAPLDNPEVIRKWARLADLDACIGHLHPSCTASNARIGRLGQLTRMLTGAADTNDQLPRLKSTPALEWLQLTASAEPDEAAGVLHFADSYAAAVQGWQWDPIRDNVRLILTEGEHLAAAPEVTLASPADPPLQSVHAVLRAEPDLRRILQQRFNVQDGEDTDWERLLDTWIERAVHKDDWSEVWKLLRRMPWEDVAAHLSDRLIYVRTHNNWRPAENVLRPGSLLELEDLKQIAEPAERDELAALLLDEEFHSDDRSLIDELGITEEPQYVWASGADQSDVGETAAEWLRSWREGCVAAYHKILDFKPDRNLLSPEGFVMPAGWNLLLLCPEDKQGAVTASLLGALNEDVGAHLAPVQFRHSTRYKAYKPQLYIHPLIALLHQYGELNNHSASIQLCELFAKDLPDPAFLPSLTPILHGLNVYSEAYSHIFRASSSAEAWQLWLTFAAAERCDAQSLTQIWQIAAEHGQAPASVCTPDGPVAIDTMRMCVSPRELMLARQAGLNAVCLSSDATRVWLEAGARRFTDDVSLEWIAESEEVQTVLLLDLEPALRDVLKPEAVQTAAAMLPDLIEQKIGSHTSATDWTLEHGRLLISQEFLSRSSWEDRIRLLIEAATAAGWVADDDALEKVLVSGVSARRRLVAAEETLPARLLCATGGAQSISSMFETDVQALLAAQPVRLAEVALTLFGPALLSAAPVHDAMRNQGLQPPDRWGTEAAADFVAAIGFPPEYAASPNQRREAEMAISGPLPLKPLHDFQEEVVAGLKVLFADTVSPRRRAVISLPTGAGKTRVAAETAVREVLASESPNRLVLWIAQSDELCEQAVQCFRELWTNIGTSGETLRLIRFWGGQINPTPASRDEPAVIVASIQTLTSRMNDPALDWANRPGLIVIDECHHALTTTYTGVLRWLSPNGRSDEREPPIVGLSATPFRGRSDDETQQLARRFDNRLIPQQQGHLFELLQARRVLAKFGYTLLTMSERFVLTADEEQHLEKFQQLNDSALKRLGEDQARNDRILTAIAEASEKSALVFATSVAHAHRLAARLNVMGISAATVTGETDRASRRWFIRAFQRGDIRVLCNHSALTTGFDAPATDLIVIARPVFSPALYMQMVGRGLRGPANGGKNHCRIMTVQDNLDAYTGKLAHHYFEQHYIMH